MFYIIHFPVITSKSTFNWPNKTMLCMRSTSWLMADFSSLISCVFFQICWNMWLCLRYCMLVSWGAGCFLHPTAIFLEVLLYVVGGPAWERVRPLHTASLRRWKIWNVWLTWKKKTKILTRSLHTFVSFVYMESTAGVCCTSFHFYIETKLVFNPPCIAGMTKEKALTFCTG